MATTFPNQESRLILLFMFTFTVYTLIHLYRRHFTSILRGKGGVPWVQIMENELEYLADRGGHGGHLGEKFLRKYCS